MFYKLIQSSEENVPQKLIPTVCKLGIDSVRSEIQLSLLQKLSPISVTLYKDIIVALLQLYDPQKLSPIYVADSYIIKVYY